MKKWIIWLGGILVLALILSLGILMGDRSPQDRRVRFSLVEVHISQDQLKILSQAGFALECSFYEKKGEELTFRIPMSTREFQVLKEKNISYQVLEEDIAKSYEIPKESTSWWTTSVKETKQSEDAPEEPSGPVKTMSLGSFGGFYTMNEFHQTLDDLYERYHDKNIITKRKSIGQSFEGREIYMVKISDNVEVDEREEEPGVLYTAMHHGQEVSGMMTVVYFMHYLLENYEDPRVQDIIHNRQLYFIPMINTDGFAYNEKYFPQGGGMWRKNRNGEGVDLNRNYGPEDYWDSENQGSSDYPWAQNYRGKKPFSEPETQALRNFLQKKKIHTAFNYHAYSNLYIYPHGFENVPAHPLYLEMAEKMSASNGYRTGTPGDLLYPVRGYSDDYFFAQDKEKDPIFAITPEVGTYYDNFWPRSDRIFPLAQDNLESNLLLAEYAAKVAQTPLAQETTEEAKAREETSEEASEEASEEISSGEKTEQ